MNETISFTDLFFNINFDIMISETFSLLALLNEFIFGKEVLLYSLILKNWNTEMQ